MKTFAMMVLGCKVNDYEATYVRNRLLEESYKEVDFKEKADIYVIFTCCVTNTAESKTRKFIHKARRENPEAYVAAVGCLCQIKGDGKEFEGVDLIIGSSNKEKIVECIKNGIRANLVNKLADSKFEMLNLASYPGKSRSFLKVQDGCNQFCSYCIIPYSRGPERCGSHDSLLKQAEILAEKNGELVLTGIHTGRYNDNGYVLSDLLKDLCRIEKLKRIRLSSIEMTEITDEIINLLKTEEKLAHHLHIPVQACSDEVLKNMHRPYTIEEFKDRVNYIRNEVPDISISTDLIVGFPGESEDIFAKSMDTMKEIAFSFIHVFPYSRKVGTVADKMENQVDPRDKKERVRRVEQMESDISVAFAKSFLNKKVSVLIEKNDGINSFGYSLQYFYVTVEGTYEPGTIVDVDIIKVENEEIVGRV